MRRRKWSGSPPNMRLLRLSLLVCTCVMPVRGANRDRSRKQARETRGFAHGVYLRLQDQHGLRHAPMALLNVSAKQGEDFQDAAGGHVGQPDRGAIRQRRRSRHRIESAGHVRFPDAVYRACARPSGGVVVHPAHAPAVLAAPTPADAAALDRYRDQIEKEVSKLD